jgi:hypothetical protein
VRHVGSIALASIFAPAIFLLTGTGLSAIDSARRGSFTDDPFGALAALGTLFLAGLIYGILVLVRLSPVGPGVAGLALMGTSSWAVLDPSSYDETFGMIDVHVGSAAGQWGLGMLLGVPLVATLTSPRRWRNEDNGYGKHDHAETVLGTQPSDPDLTRPTPALQASKTLLDILPARRAVPEAPTVPIAPASRVGISTTPPAPPDKRASPTADQPASVGPTAASTPSPVPSEQAVPPLPRRTPMVPPAMVSATPRTDGLLAAPAEDAAIPRPGSSPMETAAASPASTRLEAAPTEEVALSGPANTAAQVQTDKGAQLQEP